jgi:flagellin
MNTLAAAAGSTALYTASGSAAATATGNAFTAVTLGINGSNGSASVAVTANESAASIAASVNTATNQTNVQAQASTQLVLQATGGAGGSFNFTLGNGSAAGATNTSKISATGASGLVSAINNDTAKSGITATQNASGNIVLTQSEGKNISITGVSQGSFKAVNTPGAKTFGGTTTGSAFTAASGGATLVAQGKVSFQSDAGFSVANAKDIGLTSQSNLQSLSSVNVSTVGGANQAINIVKYAIQGLNNLGGQLGATQQRMQATLNNLTTTGANLQNGLSSVQDANIPQVSQQLTQSQIQAQAGVAALKSSSQLQQAYLSLLP